MTDSNFFIKPADGLLVRDPLTKEPLPAEGAPKPRSSYWLRRQLEGDVAEAAPSTPSSQSTKSTPSTKEGNP